MDIASAPLSYDLQDRWPAAVLSQCGEEGDLSNAFVPRAELIIFCDHIVPANRRDPYAVPLGLSIDVETCAPHQRQG
jgi:hypothetical protein